MNPAVLSGQSSIFITFLASFLIWIMLGGLVVLWIIDGRFKKEQALHALFAALLAWVLSQMIKSLFPTIRPFQMYGTMPMTLLVPFDGAFPSGHTASAFGLAVSVWLHNKKIGIIFVMGAILVGLGRILGNVHFFADVVGGSLIGVVSAYLVGRLHLYKLLGRNT